jgi:hypothetical protein
MSFGQGGRKPRLFVVGNKKFRQPSSVFGRPLLIANIQFRKFMHSVTSVHLEHCKTCGKHILDIKCVIHFSLCSDKYLTGYARGTCWKARRSSCKMPVTFCPISVGTEMCPQILLKNPNILNFMKFRSAVLELFQVYSETDGAIVIGDRNVSERT